MFTFQTMPGKRGRDDDSDSDLDEERYLKVRRFSSLLWACLIFRLEIAPGIQLPRPPWPQSLPVAVEPPVSTLAHTVAA